MKREGKKEQKGPNSDPVAYLALASWSSGRGYRERGSDRLEGEVLGWAGVSLTWVAYSSLHLAL